MSNPAAAPDPDDEVLARIMLDLERSGGPGAGLEAYLARHPHLADQIRELFQMRRALDRSRPDTDEPQPRQLGEFRIVRRIARGGMGEIYEAEQERLYRRVAIKVIRRGRISPEARDRFLREQAVLARLHQTHIVPIHTAGEEGPLQYFAMPYIEGAALHHVVRTALQLETSQPGSKTPSVARLAGMVAADSRRESQASSVGAAPVEETVAPTHAQGSGAPAAARTLRLRLSLDYFRSVAQVMADAAEALHHAHEVRIIHRDVKPSNLMVDTAGQCWVIDFGLAGYLDGHGGAGLPEEKPDLGPEPAPASGIMGTPQYMAPEQFDSRADARTDVWGLGVTLYELLTLRRAFDAPTAAGVRERILSGVPLPPRELVGNVPADLAAICLKALRKEPGQRYATAQEMADDLRRWLRLEPTRARPARAPRRMWLWARRNKGAAASILLAVLTVVTTLGATLLHERARVAAAEADRAAAKRQAEMLLLQQTRMPLENRKQGWFDGAWEVVRKLARTGKEDELRNQAAATLAGIDARCIKEFRFEASSMAFDDRGKRLLIGGFRHPDRNTLIEPPRIWDVGGDEARPSRQKGAGPVGFRAADGAALQLTVKPEHRFTLWLWNIDKEELVREFPLVTPEPAPADYYSIYYLTLALSADGSRVAVSATLPDEKETLLVWNVQAREPLLRKERKFTALSFSPNNALLAGGDDEGRITIWSLEEGKELTSLRSGRTAIRSLAFARDPKRGEGKEPAEGSWLLAAGDATGTIVLLDLPSGQIRTRYPGSAHAVHALAFSPDSALLASAGRTEGKVWDVATGRLLLNLTTGRNTYTGVAFSPDGNLIAVSSRTTFTVYPGGVDVWQLDRGRGIQTLLGLSSRISQVRFSPKGRFLAALSDGWEVAIWELATAKLWYVLEVPQGYTTDNAGLAFSHDEKLFAFATRTKARMWDLETGKLRREWSGLPPAYNDHLAFDPAGTRLLLFRVETRDRKVPPSANADPQKHPRVLRVRDLLPDPVRELYEITEFPADVDIWAVPPDGSYVVARVGHDTAKKDDYRIVAYEGTSKKELPFVHRVARSQNPAISIDPTGGRLAHSLSNEKRASMTLVEMPSGKFLEAWSQGLHSLGPGADKGIDTKPGTPWPFRLVRPRDGAVLIEFDLDGLHATNPAFNVAGTHLAWGNRDGTVTVVDLNEAQRRLAAVGLGW